MKKGIREGCTRGSAGFQPGQKRVRFLWWYPTDKTCKELRYIYGKQCHKVRCHAWEKLSLVTLIWRVPTLLSWSRPFMLLISSHACRWADNLQLQATELSSHEPSTKDSIWMYSCCSQALTLGIVHQCQSTPSISLMMLTVVLLC